MDNPNPYIYQLPEPIQKLALKRQYEQGFREDRFVRLNVFNFKGVFNWNLTDEGMEFWELINIGEYDVFYKMYPNEKPKEKGINLDELQSEAEKLVSLLKDRNLGLMAWNESLSKQVKSLRDLLD